MDISPGNLIASLYARARTAMDDPAPAASATAPRPGVAEKAADFMASLREAEATAIRGLTGRADPQSVVMALAATELAVETAVTVRDKVVEAYQEILRMPV
ncbi:MAG: flagellar hook-basal body protein FliE [Paracoccaceae bacterium]|nr:MAG: flagellar hook-basal body complex protein FliE [Alphaproteobacteria bacterium]GIX15472.1 MAG: flagellar hook-basal body protein FliE [Paracoccaceae bacterium]